MIVNVKKSAANNSIKYKTDLSKITEEMTALKDSKNVLEKKLKHCNCTSGAVTISSISSVTTKNNNKTSNEQTKIDQVMTTAKAEIHRLVSHELYFLIILD